MATKAESVSLNRENRDGTMMLRGIADGIVSEWFPDDAKAMPAILKDIDAKKAAAEKAAQQEGE